MALAHDFAATDLEPEAICMTIRRLDLVDSAVVARVLRESFDERLPWLAGLHTPSEDAAFFAHVVFKECDVWGFVEQEPPNFGGDLGCSNPSLAACLSGCGTSASCIDSCC